MIRTAKHIAQGDVGMWQRMMAQKLGLTFAEGAKGTVEAVINHSRWIAYCPFCAGAEAVEQGELFFCMSCGMDKNKFHPMNVEFPKERKEIEEALLTRYAENRNWTSEQTVNDLIAENVTHVEELAQ